MDKWLAKKIFKIIKETPGLYWIQRHISEECCNIEVNMGTFFPDRVWIRFNLFFHTTGECQHFAPGKYMFMCAGGGGGCAKNNQYGSTSAGYNHFVASTKFYVDTPLTHVMLFGDYQGLYCDLDTCKNSKKFEEWLKETLLSLGRTKQARFDIIDAIQKANLPTPTNIEVHENGKIRVKIPSSRGIYEPENSNVKKLAELFPADDRHGLLTTFINIEMDSVKEFAGLLNILFSEGG